MATLAEGDQIEFAIIGRIAVDVMNSKDDVCLSNRMETMIISFAKFTLLSGTFTDKPRYSFPIFGI